MTPGPASEFLHNGVEFWRQGPVAALVPCAGNHAALSVFIEVDFRRDPRHDLAVDHAYPHALRLGIGEVLPEFCPHLLRGLLDSGVGDNHPVAFPERVASPVELRRSRQAVDVRQ